MRKYEGEKIMREERHCNPIICDEVTPIYNHMFGYTLVKHTDGLVGISKYSPSQSHEFHYLFSNKRSEYHEFIMEYLRKDRFNECDIHKVAEMMSSNMAIALKVVSHECFEGSFLEVVSLYEAIEELRDMFLEDSYDGYFPDELLVKEYFRLRLDEIGIFPMHFKKIGLSLALKDGKIGLTWNDNNNNRWFTNEPSVGKE